MVMLPCHRHSGCKLYERAVCVQADVPRRASLRQRGVAADGSMIDEERRNGELVIINGERIRLAPGQAIEDLPPRERHPQGPRPLPTHHHQPEGHTYTVEAPLPPTPVAQ